MSYVKVKGHNGMAKDLQTGAVVNTDRAALLAARKRKKEILEEKNKIKTMEDRIEFLESKLNQILGET